MQITRIFDLSPLLHAAAIEVGHEVTGDLRWLHVDADDLMLLTDADRELVSVLTGEHFLAVTEAEVPVSFVVRQLMLDRATGALAPGEDISIGYAEAVYDRYAACATGSPFSEELFDFALAFLVGRDLARLDPEGLHLDV